MRGLLSFLSLIVGSFALVEENWDSIDNRVVPDWYDKAKVGIFIHWGLFAVPGFNSEWFWNEWKTDHNQDVEEFVNKNYPPGFTYQEFANQLTGEFFNATVWADLFIRAGARYVVLTSKHHEGFTLWPSKYTYSFNSVDNGPHRDIVKELGEAAKAAGLKYGLYHSLLEWYHPLYVADKAENTTYFVDQKIIPEMIELVSTYEPDILWSDGGHEMPDTYWKSLQFLTWLFNESPVKDTVLTNDRWGDNVTCLHGDIRTCMDKYNPGYLLAHKWENAMTIDRNSWGFRRNSRIEDYLTPKELIALLIETVACGGNILINIGPTKEGHIAPIFQERLLQLGDWLSINGEAIYESNPWTEHQNDTLTSGVWFTQRDGITYATFLNWPQDGILKLGAVATLFNETTQVSILESNQTLTWSQIEEEAIQIQLPDRASVGNNEAWVLRLK